MFEKIKKYGVKVLVFLLNLGLVGGGAAYIKNQRDKQKEAESKESAAIAEQEARQIADKAKELDQIIQNSANQKTESVANNPSEVTIQQPKTVTEVVPGGTTTVKSTKTTSSKTPSKTTKKS